MCGICGIYHFGEAEPVSQHVLQQMCAMMVHRGPDDEGAFVHGSIGFGMRRLAIIDLSPAGHQPMSNEDETVWIVLNGEIYNYLELAVELKHKGHRFRSQSDTEVVLHLYEDYGPDCVTRLNGMFAFAIWDGRNRRLFAARDRLGIKPFYYYVNNDSFGFASEIKALFCAPFVPRRPNEGAILEYMNRGYVPGKDTFFQGIRKLLPGHYLSIQDGRLSLTQYWDIKFQTENRSEQYYVDGLRELLQDAVRLHLRSDVPVGSHLSGGLDSSLVVALASQILPTRLHSFSGAFAEGGEYDERRYINAMVDKFNTVHHVIILTAEDFERFLPEMIWYMDEPDVGTSTIPQYYVCRLASQHVKVVLGGQGGDELFGGYYRFIPSYLRSYLTCLVNRRIDSSSVCETGRGLLRHIRTVGVGQVINKIESHRRPPDPFTREFKQAAERNSPLAARAYGSLPDADPLNQAMYWEIKNYLPSLLHVEDRTSMAVSIESRVPFLDYRVVEFAASVPSHLRLWGLSLKYVEREVARPLLPMEIVQRRDKNGFYTPVSIWFRGALSSSIGSILLSQSCRQRGILAPVQVEKMVREHSQGSKDHAIALWKMLNVELWYQQFMDHASGSVNR